MAVKAESKDIGDRATPQWTWTVNDVATDPTQIVVKQQDAAGVETTVTTASSPGTLTTASTPLARMSAGVFRLNPGSALTAQGYWLIRAEATGTAEAAAPDFLYKVQPSEFYSNAGLSFWALVGLQETKDWLQQQNIQTGEELELVRVINDISMRFIEESETEFKNYDSTSSATVRQFDVGYDEYYGMTVNVGGSSTTPTLVRVLAEDGTAAATITDYSLRPRNRKSWEPISHLQFKSYAFRPLPNYTVEVTGVWGYPSVPGNVRVAVLDAIAYTIDRDVEHWREDLSPISGGGTALALSLPPATMEIAAYYRNPSVG